jgi:hypothetical protein
MRSPSEIPLGMRILDYGPKALGTTSSCFMLQLSCPSPYGVTALLGRGSPWILLHTSIVHEPALRVFVINWWSISNVTRIPEHSYRLTSPNSSMKPLLILKGFTARRGSRLHR